MRIRIPARARSVTIAAVSAMLLAACATGPGSGNAATVDGVAVALETVERIVRTQSADPANGFDDMPEEQRAANLAELQRNVTTTLIRAEILKRVAADLGVTVTDDALDDAFDSEVAFAGGEEELREQIAAIGLSEEEFRDIILADRVRQDGIRDAVRADISVTDQEVQDAYDAQADQWERASARHILVETEAEADDLLAQLSDGADFSELAEEHSLDTQSAALGGDLGSQPRGAYVPEFDEAVWSAEPGELVGPVQTDFGFHLIIVDEQVVTTLDEVEESLRTELENAALQVSLRDVLAEAFASARVVVDSRIGEWDPEAGVVVDDDPLLRSPGGDPAPPGPPVNENS